jgi:hypothetical protein
MTSKKSKKNDSRYISPEMMPYALCNACLEVVIENNEKAREIYEDIVECFGFPGCQAVSIIAKEVLPDSNILMKDLIEKSGFDVKKPPDKETFKIPYTRGVKI